MMRRTADTGDGGSGGGWGGDIAIGEQPDAQAEARDYSESMDMGQLDDPKTYQWSMTGTHISVSDDYDHGSLFEGMGHMDWSQPHAWGTVEVSYNWEARWSIEGSSMALHTVEQRLKRYSRDQGWKHVTILDDSGMESKVGARTADYTGVGEGNYPSGDWQTHDEVGEVDPGNFAGFGDPTDDEKPSGPMVCSTCGEPFPTYDDWAKHVDQVHRNPDREPDPAPQPVVDLDQPIPAGFNTFNTGDETVMRKVAQTMRERYAAGQELINGPMLDHLPDRGARGETVWVRGGSFIVQEWVWVDD